MTPDCDRARVDAFVARNFGLAGTLRLHRHAVGWDLLRAPANIMLAPVYLATRLFALSLSVLGARQAARWIGTRRILFRSAVARAVERAIFTELLSPTNSNPGPTPDQLKRIENYTDVRNAVAEICTTALVLALGYALFQIATPGIVSLTPVLSSYAAQSSAIASFPLGTRLGGMWYSVFPVELPFWFLAIVAISLAVAASLVTTFAGLIADPIQAWTGLHARRLRKLLRLLASEKEAEPTLEREHVMARLADISDAAVSLLRLLRP